MADLEDTLARIPGLAGYLGQEQFTQRQNTGQLANLNQAATLQSHYDGIRKERGLRDALNRLGPDAKEDDVMRAVAPFVGADTAFKAIEARKAREATLQQNSLLQTQRLDTQMQRFREEMDRLKLPEASRRRAEMEYKMRLQGANAEYTLPSDILGKYGLGGGAAPQQGGGMPYADALAVAKARQASGQPVGTIPTSGPQPIDQMGPQGAPVPSEAAALPGGAPTPPPPAALPVAPPVAPQAMPSPAPDAGNLDARDIAARAAAPAPAPAPEPVAPVQGAPVARGEVPPPQGAPVARGLPVPPPELAAQWSQMGRKDADKARAKWYSDTMKSQMNELPPLTGEALASAASQHANGVPLMQISPGYSRNMGDRREMIRQAAIKQIQDENPGMSTIAAGQALANRKVEMAASNRSVTQLTTMLGATRQAVDQLDFNVKKVTEAMNKLPGGEAADLSPIITAISRGASKWTGDPAYTELFYYMHAAGMESARILQGGQASIAQLHQGAADQASQWASANWTTPKQWKEGVAPAMQAEGAERIKTYERAIKEQRMGAGRNPAAPAEVAAPAGRPTAKQIADSGWSYEPDKYEYRMVGGKVQRKEK